MFLFLLSFLWQFAGSGHSAQSLCSPANPGPVVQPTGQPAPCSAAVSVGHTSGREPTTFSGEKRHRLPLEPESAGPVQQ